MHKWLGLFLLLGFAVQAAVPYSAGAQGETKLEAINIELWSEWDRPSMLVIYQFVVSPDTPLPAEVTLRFPINSNLVAVAVESNGGLFNKDFTTPVKQENWQTIKINVETYETHRIEYYQPLNLDGNKRRFKYHWFGDYYAKTFSVGVRLPADSADLVTSPALENTTTSSDADGSFITGKVTKNDLKPMNSFQFELEYQRTSNAVIKENPSDQVQASTPVGEDTLGRVSIANLPWIIGAFGLALIGIALFSYWRSTQANESQPRKRHRQKPEDADTGAGEAYCHECGTRAHPGDRFCRTCGSRLRVE
jgi:hypothetical protein